MDADILVRAIRAALDETERDEATRHEFGCAVTDPAYEDPPRDADLTDIMACSCPVRDRLRLIAAAREIAERHQPRMLPAMPYRPAMAECEYCASQCHSRSGLGCDEPVDAPWPCPDFAALARGLGINPEEETT